MANQILSRLKEINKGQDLASRPGLKKISMFK